MAAMSIKEYRHCFIVLGFEKCPSYESYGMMNHGPPIEWGKNTVVCDPWYNEWFASDVDWVRKVRQILRRSSGTNISDNAVLRFKMKSYIPI